MAKLWVRLIKKNKIWRQETEPLPPSHSFADVRGALDEVAKRLDVPRPIWMQSHERQYESFSQTRFTQDHFVESVPFDRMELEIIE